VTEKNARRVILVACILCLTGLAMFVWSVVAPSPASVMIAMSVGQGLGTLSFALYLWVVIGDMLRARVLDERKDE
jgi:peptidoglycan/LPS O-acetylase OafA/YrhL